MTAALQEIAQKCLDGAYHGSMSFPDIVNMLIQNGFESYRIDYMRHVVTYYLSDGDSFDLSLPHHDGTPVVAKTFDAPAVQTAIKEAQQQVEGYTYMGFCEKVMQAGCAGYIVSFLGKRVLYFGRTAETHVEHFPQ